VSIEKCTPGEWFAEDGVIYVRGGDGIMANPPLKYGSGWIEEAWCGEDADAETLANTFMMAASKAMYLALEALASGEIDASHTALIYDSNPLDLLKAARSALASARGEQP